MSSPAGIVPGAVADLSVAEFDHSPGTIVASGEVRGHTN